MSLRSIIRDPNILDGRWHFEGSTIPVGAVRIDRAAYIGPAHDYVYLDLNTEEIASALSFSFPFVRDLGVQMVYAGFTLLCECGEDTHQTMSGFETVHIRCLCGREWTVQLLANKVRDVALA